MAVKKGALDNFLKPISRYSDNQKSLRSIFIDKDEDDLKPEPPNSFEASFITENTIGTQDTPYTTQPDQNSLQTIEIQAPEDRPYSIDYTTPSRPLETDNKPATNRQQIDNKQVTNRKQTDNKIEPKKENWQQTGNATGNKTSNNVATNRQQTDNKLTTKIPFSKLVGLQRDIIIFICHECKNSRSRITESLTLEHIAKSLERSTGAIKTTIQRLEKKGCLQRVEFKVGRGGWSRYELPDDIYHSVLRIETGNKLATNWEQTDNKLASQPATEPATSPSSSSSSNNIKTTTTDLPPEWNFDITPYARFGFTISQIKQLSSLGVITAADVEQSLIEFSHDLDTNALPFIKTRRANFLMGLLRSGNSYVSEGFQNEQEAAISEMARRAEGNRKKRLEEKFGAWEAGLNVEERKKVLANLKLSLIVLEKAHGICNEEVRKGYFDYFMRNVNDKG